jgi:DNA (cytosine-5)-methyltransferase 1
MAGSYVSLFSGCGGIDLGLEAAGWQSRWMCENDRACRKVLAERWGDLHVLGDVKDVEGGDASGSLDLVVGGFP